MNTPDTPTPRTDEAECENFPSTEPIVAAKRMRQLERELTAAKEELANAQDKADAAVWALTRVQEENATLRAAMDTARAGH